MDVRKVNLAEKFGEFAEQWSPKIAGEVNDSYVKLVKFQGDFVWHRHENEDEMWGTDSNLSPPRAALRCVFATGTSSWKKTSS